MVFFPFPRWCARVAAVVGATVSCGLSVAPSIGSASVTSLSAGKGISLSPNPITSTGTISLLLPLSLSLPEPTQLLSLTNTSTAATSGGLSAQGHTFGLSGTGGAAGSGEGVLGHGATSGAVGVLGIGGGSSAGVAGNGGTTNGTGGSFNGGASGVTDQTPSGTGIVAQGGAANPEQSKATVGGVGLRVSGGNDSRPVANQTPGEAGPAIIARGGNGTNGNFGGDGLEAFAGSGGALAGLFTGNVSVAGNFGVTGSVSVNQGDLGVEGTVTAGALDVPLKFQTLTLENGWTGGAFNTAVPAVALDGQGIVHFRGGMYEPGSFNPDAFILPAQLDPSHPVYVVADMADGTTGRLEISVNGQVAVKDTNSGKDAKDFTSLDGVTYALG